MIPPIVLWGGVVLARHLWRKYGNPEVVRDFQSEPHHPDSVSGTTANLQRLRDLAVLGLDETATLRDVEAAFRRLAQVHHPDRFNGQGDDAIHAANRAFLLLRAAYDRLKVSPGGSS